MVKNEKYTTKWAGKLESESSYGANREMNADVEEKKHDVMKFEGSLGKA